ncbi:uncharacterized protein LOC106637987 [Copidosoma floridanum]|uniref:uncharacterized protein LOC106637987 n=1 Tax=Copidosoma floridanum TaxID=29053 RepID=UPI0006C98F2A|nr:uncharacterized protein LOC106637987 [Copidosoma floridanum]
MANFIRHFCVRGSASFSGLKPVMSSISNSQRLYSSALFVPGNKANKTFTYLTPNIDFSDYFADIQNLQKELNQRDIKIDAQELKKAWDYYQFVRSNRDALEEKLSIVNGQLQEFFKNNDLSADDLKRKEDLQHQNKLIKQDIKAIKEAAWELEESVIPQVLKLPNETDKRTPIESPLLLKSVGEKSNFINRERHSHLDIGKNLGLLEYKNPIQYYLCDKAALFELEALALAGEILKQSNSMRVALPDFCRSIIVEGCGMDHESSVESFMLQNDTDVKEEYLVNRLHLVGGASLPAMLAMYTKQAFKPSDFPIRIFSAGRHYTPFPSSLTVQHGLFSVCQASAVQALTLVKDKDSKEYKEEFERLIEAATKIYNDIGCHYRVVIRPAKELNLAESMRLSFEMYSVHADQYVEIGHVSACGDYFSKRLMIACPTTTSVGYPAAVSGTLLSVPKMLGCLIEENPDEFVTPEKLRGLFD